MADRVGCLGVVKVINDSDAQRSLPPWVLVRVNDEVQKALDDVSAMSIDAGDAKALLAERAQRGMEVLLNDQEILRQLIQNTLDRATRPQRERYFELLNSEDADGAWRYLDSIAESGNRPAG